MAGGASPRPATGLLGRQLDLAATRLWLLPIGLLAALGQLCMTRAYATAKTEAVTLVVANLQYSGIVFAAFYSVVLFDDRIDAGRLGRHGAYHRERHCCNRVAAARSAAPTPARGAVEARNSPRGIQNAL